jgi:hypothetical protein
MGHECRIENEKRSDTDGDDLVSIAMARGFAEGAAFYARLSEWDEKPGC